MKARLLYTVALVALGPPGAALAAENEAEASVTEVIVTAQRRSERLQDVPLSVTAQSGVQLERANVTSTRDLVKVIPGLTMTYNGSWAQPTVRGITGTSSQSGNDAAVPIYIDGFYHPNQVSNTFELPDVQQIEVLKGPQGTLFGRNSTGGAVLVTTRAPSFSPRGKLMASYGGYQDGGEGSEATLKGYLSGPVWSDKVAGSVSFIHTRDTGYFRDIVTGRTWGGVKAMQVYGKLLVRLTENIEITPLAYYGRRDDLSSQVNQPLRGNTVARRLFPTTPIPRGPWDVAFTVVDTPRTLVNDVGGGVHVKADLGWATLNSRTGYEKVQNHSWSDPDGTAARVADSASIQRDSPFQQEVVLASTPSTGSRLSWLAGAFYYTNHSIFQNPLTGVNGYVDTLAWAGFGEVSYDVTDRLTLIGGLRYSWERKTQHAGTFPTAVAPMPLTPARPRSIPLLGDPASWDSFTPRASLRYKVNDSVNVYATYSKGFKSGAYSISALSPIAVDPETVSSYELGAKITTGRLSVSASTFYYDWSNLQVGVLRDINGQLFTFLANAASAEIYGLDFDGSWRVTPSLTVRATMSYLPTAKYKSFPGAAVFPARPDGLGGNTSANIDASGRRLIRAPKVTASLGATYLTHFSGGDVEASGNLYHSDPYNWEPLGQVKAPSYTTLDASLSWSPAAHSVRFTIWGKNLTNAVFQTTGIPNTASDWVRYGPPRQIGASVAYEF